MYYQTHREAEQHDAKQRENDKQIYTYQADWVIYALGFSWRESTDFRLALGSLKEDLTNEIQIIKLSDSDTEDFVCTTKFDHNFPATKLLWLPDRSDSHPDLLATTSDFLRIWEVDDDNKSVSCKSELKDNTQTFSAPLTSFDWNQKDPSIIGVCSLDTTCSIWDVGRESIKAQLIAHDKEVFDIGFQDINSFATVGADGSMRLFDLRALEHSTILYETNHQSTTGEGKPLLKLGWNNQDPSYIATFEPDSSKVVILDIRVPMIPVCELEGHTDYVDAFSWAPHSSCHICTAGDDMQALIWDLSVMPSAVTDPILSYKADAEITSLQWSATQHDWVAISFNKTLQMLRV
ncbi:unnamed protein product [Moneuplotes crassus]|uniref:Uncharacterized protein n=1 Tax=Euplotes crassus TaxID=5936 RepID=A0AAD2CYA3_EUPCR|nr:unnamed protein product [Moneuplotes crassus]